MPTKRAANCATIRAVMEVQRKVVKWQVEPVVAVRMIATPKSIPQIAATTTAIATATTAVQPQMAAMSATTTAAVTVTSTATATAMAATVEVAITVGIVLLAPTPQPQQRALGRTATTTILRASSKVTIALPAGTSNEKSGRGDGATITTSSTSKEGNVKLAIEVVTAIVVRVLARKIRQSTR